METPYKTPGKAKSSENLSKKSVIADGKAKAVDLVTGKATVEYFFDPSLLIDESVSETPLKTGRDPATPIRRDLSATLAAEGNGDALFYGSKHLYMPCSIIKSLEGGTDTEGIPSSGPTLVKTNDGKLHKVSDSTKLIPLTAPDDYIGMDDVLHLAHVTEASLLHTLRLRYKRDDIYTSAGPILMSINPYKPVTNSNGESLYSEKQMILYRSRELGKASGVVRSDEDLPPHLFEVADRAYSALIESVQPTDPIHLEEEDAVLDVEAHLRPGTIRSQSIIISGESGAGKTEATKIIMQYLSRITKKSKSLTPIKSPDGKLMAALEDRVLSSNPLLESFGNARTLRNDNSSRFGKFIRISFSTDSGHIMGASIANYLLEKTRITTQVDGERNYHIFYQLLTGAGTDMLKDLVLEGGVSAFRYLGNRESQRSRRDAAGFVETKKCLTGIGLSLEEQHGIFKVLSAVLHLGNVNFEEIGDGSGDDDQHGHNEHAKISEGSLPSLQTACNLLGLEESKVSEAILTKLLSIGGKTIHKPQSLAQASDKRDALAKLTYSSLFVWLVHRVNKTISPCSHGLEDSDINSVGSDASFTVPGQVQNATKTEGGEGFIGVLDIYGFESFDVNGYEQLLINYCNEKLQRHFNRHLFEVEQELYSSEGVDWTYITFNDNRPCLELIEGGGGSVGILNTLDDAWGGMGSASEKDVNFVSHLHSLFGGVQSSTVKARKKKKKAAKQNSAVHPNFVMPKFGSDRQFVVIHYAGEVKYTANGFVEKNMESLSNELKDLGTESALDLVKDVFETTTNGMAPVEAGAARRSTIRGVSVGSQFRSSLQSLVADLELTQPHYVRCVKPNLSKDANSFDSGAVLRQLRYAGMMETIRIRREGYALREEHKSFYNRFSMLLNPEDYGDGAGIQRLVKVLSKRLTVSDHDWQIGHSKIFLRRELADKLERLARLKVHAAARSLGRFGRIVSQRSAAYRLVVWMRFSLHMLKKRRQDRAATAIAAIFRMHCNLRAYASSLWLVKKLQALQRRKLAITYTNKMRDPYADMTFKELESHLQSEQARLEAAIQEKNFKLAATLEALLAPLEEAMESKRPLTRRVLESRIEEVQKALDKTLSRKAYVECAPLQDKLEKLMKLRKSVPTIEEIQEELDKAEAAVALAAKNRDFTAAASGQARIDDAKEKLKSAYEAEGLHYQEADDTPDEDEEAVSHKVSSRVELETEIQSLSLKIEESIKAKDFKTASSLQQTLEQKESLRSNFPTVSELNDDLAQAKKELDKAIVQKDFSGASALDQKIATIRKRIAQEMEIASPSDNGSAQTQNKDCLITTASGDKKVVESRVDLDSEIVSTKELIASAVKSKDFKQAQMLQGLVDHMETLRIKFPSVKELEVEIAEKQASMDAAITKKSFAEAERIHQCIVDIEKKLETERARAPKPEPVPEKENVPNRSDFSVPKHSSRRTRKIRQSILASEGFAPPRNKKPDSNLLSNTAIEENPNGENLPSNASSNLIASSRKGSESRAMSSMRSVLKLRPKKPLLAKADDVILSVTQMLANKRGDAALVVGDAGGLAGIITDTDVTRRVVAKHVDPASTAVSKVMTAGPTCVSVSDSAMDALTTMVENHFRHLPVVDENGAVVGLLDIAKCLNDAISKLERNAEKHGSAAEEAVDQMTGLQSAENAQAAALQALLVPLLAKAFGGKASPSLRSLLAGKPATIVSPDSSVGEAGGMMAEHRKAALVVDDGNLVGIFGFKDMMTRVVAKERSIEDTSVSEVMTPNPDCASPDMTVLDALQMMHDEKLLTLPVCEKDGSVVGLVDVMDVIYGCGGADGWRSVFGSAMEVDDVTETKSVNSRGSAVQSLHSRRTKSSVKTSEKVARPVSKLRPKKPLLSRDGDTVLSVCQMLASKRGDAALVLGDSGDLAGIITDTDVTRRVVAKQVDPGTTVVSNVMTTNPTCVSISDPAMDALATMVENHFRHLPVVDENGAVVGLLDIAKCLNDAISKLERNAEKHGSAAEEAVDQMTGLQGAENAQAAALQALLVPLLAKAFGGKASPSLRSLLAGKPATIVSPDSSVGEAGGMMAEHRKAALVVDDGNLVGIFGFKDMMTRVVAKERSIEDTSVSEVMTPNPDCASPDMTVLDALQMMHDEKLLTLPVCEKDGSVVGLVDVMDVIYGCGGADGWRSVFSSAMEVDDVTETKSVNSRGSAAQSLHSRRTKSSVKTSEKVARPVSKLRPKKPLLSRDGDTILSVCQMLASNRGCASLVLSSRGKLSGIFTDTDVTRRVVAKQVDTSTMSVSAVMTSNPTCVAMSDSAMDALGTMVENRFRHLPVVDDNGSVVGLLDIARCLNDAITKLEQARDRSETATENAVEQIATIGGAGGVQAGALQAVLGPLLAKAFGQTKSPSLRSLLENVRPNVVSPDAVVLEVAKVMTQSRKAALIVEDGELLGIFGFKDMMTRVVANELEVEETTVSEVMTPDPEFVSPDVTVLEALQMMHDHKFLSLPVCEEDGSVVGLVDVMDVIHGCGGADGWKSVFNSTIDMDGDFSEEKSMISSPAPLPTSRKKVFQGSSEPQVMVSPDTRFASVPNNIPTHVEIDDAHSMHGSVGISLLQDKDFAGMSRGFTDGDTAMSDIQGIVFKVLDSNCKTHRIRCGLSLEKLLEKLTKKVGADVDTCLFQLQFFDDEGDAIAITTNDDLAEAVNLARSSGNSVVKLTVSLRSSNFVKLDKQQKIILLSGAGVALAIGAIAMIAMRPRK